MPHALIAPWLHPRPPRLRLANTCAPTNSPAAFQPPSSHPLTAFYSQARRHSFPALPTTPLHTPLAPDPDPRSPLRSYGVTEATVYQTLGEVLDTGPEWSGGGSGGASSAAPNAAPLVTGGAAVARGTAPAGMPLDGVLLAIARRATAGDGSALADGGDEGGGRMLCGEIVIGGVQLAIGYARESPVTAVDGP